MSETSQSFFTPAVIAGDATVSPAANRCGRPAASFRAGLKEQAEGANLSAASAWGRQVLTAGTGPLAALQPVQRDIDG